MQDLLIYMRQLRQTILINANRILEVVSAFIYAYCVKFWFVRAVIELQIFLSSVIVIN